MANTMPPQSDGWSGDGGNDVEEILLEPRVFKAPGLTPDVLLDVFDQPFHVHSVVLKLYSNFFRVFLNNSENVKDSFSAFKYHCSTGIDDDGTWGLEPASKAKPLTVEMINKIESRWSEVTAFGNLFCAMYNRPYKLEDIGDLRAFVRIADFYCALPIVSNTITAPSLESTMFRYAYMEHSTQYFGRDPYLYSKLLVLAKKLLNPLVPADLNLPEDLVIRMQWGVPRAFYIHLKRTIHKERELSDIKDFIEELEQVLDELLVNNLSLSAFSGDLRQGGEFDYDEREFYCANLKDEDLPWDPEEVDW